MIASRMTPLAIAALLAAVGAAWAQEPPPRFRSSIELVSVDVQVVDASGRPIVGLESQDFEVSIGGKRRRVLNAEFVQYRSGTDPQGAAVPGLAATGVAPEAAAGRTFIIGVDEHSIRFGAARAAMEAARRFMARLGPRDLVGLFAYPTGTARIDPTTDHPNVLAELDKVTALLDLPQSRYNVSASEAIDIASRSLETLKQVQQNVSVAATRSVSVRSSLPLNR